MDLTLDKRVYRPGDLVTGLITIMTHSLNKRFDYVRVSVHGKTTLGVSPASVGLFEAFYAPPEPVIWLKRQTDLARNGSLALGRNDFTFELALAPTTARQLVETLKGDCVQTVYTIDVEVYRGIIARTLYTQCEFQVQVPEPVNQSKPTLFKVDDVLVGEVMGIVYLPKPIVGHVVILPSRKSIVGVEVELIRMEDVYWGGEEDFVSETHVIQSIQIIDGCLASHSTVPFSIVVPRLIASPTVSCPEFQVNYGINVVVTFQDGTASNRLVHLLFARC